jgi:hypothetical protein
MEKQTLIDLLKAELSEKSREFKKQSGYLSKKTGKMTIADINKAFNEKADVRLSVSLNELSDLTELSKHRVANGYTFLTSGDLKIKAGHAQFCC